ncbi:Gfo/Idh/MocA family oxidoreductase [Nodosilinea sp. FACHB-13]|uniref:Gfo/Idh/MocA family protein n=1 Tax=Cyanophyceae TaxID=3028117 RepID=UPI001682EC1E|nr:Gfo/Idh/MocA family oxidoreductase [Nodosilinea sp. FACHB-13]MBD2110084.1 Gfo/Idh/MocA family oxidoreductase [Nodosilinea sp. FACHB-13]
MTASQTSLGDRSVPKEVQSSSENRIRYAVVGLGWFAQTAALPSFPSSENSEVVALVSDDPVKLQELSQNYGIQHTYSYDEYEDCLTSGAVDAVYIALPDHLHCEYTVRAANQGIHVLCEKPMATTVAEGERMIQACQSNGVKLMIAYRLHLDPANMRAVEIVQSGQIGQPRIFNSVFSQQVKGNNIRLRQATGGGTLEDIGIYCINAARYLFQAEPVEVFAMAANNGEERFREVDEMSSVIIRFPDQQLANFTVSFGASPVSTYHIIGTEGDLRLESAYAWDAEITHHLTINNELSQRTFASHGQLAAEFAYFSNCIMQNEDPEPSGIEGLNDIRIICALHESIQQGKPVVLDQMDFVQHPTADLITVRPTSVDPANLIHAASPEDS